MKQDINHRPTSKAAVSELPQAEPLLISAAELAQLLNVSTRTLWRLLSAGKLIAPVKIGGNTRWRLEEVHQWVSRGCPAPGASENGTRPPR